MQQVRYSEERIFLPALINFCEILECKRSLTSTCLTEEKIHKELKTTRRQELFEVLMTV
jgi:hypothetical protein